MWRAARSCCASIALREKFAAAACVHALQAAVAKALEQLYAGWQLAAAGSASFAGGRAAWSTGCEDAPRAGAGGGLALNLRSVQYLATLSGYLER